MSTLKQPRAKTDPRLNVSRETLQNHRFLQQLQRILIRKAIDLFGKIASDEPEKYKDIAKVYGNALRIGLLESPKDKVKLAKLLRFESTRTDYTSLEDVRSDDSPLRILTSVRGQPKGRSKTGESIIFPKLIELTEDLLHGWSRRQNRGSR